MRRRQGAPSRNDRRGARPVTRGENVVPGLVPRHIGTGGTQRHAEPPDRAKSARDQGMMDAAGSVTRGS